MKRKQPTTPEPDFHTLMERSDEVFAAISEIVDTEAGRDLEKLDELVREATSIADQMAKCLQHRSPSNSGRASFQYPASRTTKFRRDKATRLGTE